MDLHEMYTTNLMVFHAPPPSAGTQRCEHPLKEHMGKYRDSLRLHQWHKTLHLISQALMTSGQKTHAGAHSDSRSLLQPPLTVPYWFQDALGFILGSRLDSEFVQTSTELMRGPGSVLPWRMSSGVDLYLQRRCRFDSHTLLIKQP